MIKILKERWMKLAGVVKEQTWDEQDTEEAELEAEWDRYESDQESWDEPDDRDYVPGASAWSHSGRWEDYYDEDREKGEEMSKKSLKDLKDEGFTDEEILDILKDL